MKSYCDKCRAYAPCLDCIEKRGAIHDKHRVRDITPTLMAFLRSFDSIFTREYWEKKD